MSSKNSVHSKKMSKLLRLKLSDYELSFYTMRSALNEKTSVNVA